MSCAPGHRGKDAGLTLLLLASCTGCTLPVDPEIADRVAQVNETELMRHVEALCRIGPRPAGYDRQTEQTLAYLEGELRRWGYQPVREPFGAYVPQVQRRVAEDGEVTFVLGARKAAVRHNLVVVHRGTYEPERVLEVGAHYDSVFSSPGANDNASGVAAVLEIARLLASRYTARTVRLVFFAMEENGLIGSREHVRNLVKQGNLPVGILALDGIGYATDEADSQGTPIRIPLLFSPPTTGNFTLVAGNFSSGWLGARFESCIEAYVPDLPYYSLNRLAGWFKDADRGDHYSYWKAGIPAVAIVDGMEYRNPNYHRPSDRPATLNRTFLHQNTQAVLATVLQWAGRVTR